jgi:hypothetical protein
MKHAQVVVAFMFVALCCTVSHSYADVTIQKESFTITLPDGWIEIPQDGLTAMFAELERQAPDAKIPKYDYGFQLGSSQNWMEYPYILVQLNKASRIPEHQLKSLPTIDLNAKIKDQAANMQSLMSSISIGKMQYDQAAHVVWLTMQSDVVNVGRIRGISGLIPTETGFVQVHAYSTESDFQSYLPIFRQIITATAINPSLVYKPRWTDSSPIISGIDWGQMAGKAIVGGVIGGLIAIFVGIRRKKK